MTFDKLGQLVDCGVPESELNALIQSGKPFQTSGCPGKENDISACNRPYGDSPPSDILSFPFALNEIDIEGVRNQMTLSNTKSI